MKTSPMKCHMPPHESPISRMKRWVSFTSIILFYTIWFSLFLMTRVDSKLLLARVVYFKESWSVCIICYDYPLLGNTIKPNHLCLAWLDFCFNRKNWRFRIWFWDWLECSYDTPIGEHRTFMIDQLESFGMLLFQVTTTDSALDL